MAMHAEEGSNVLAVPGLPARYARQRVQALPFLDVCFTSQALL
jgi:hypothetical protein